MIVRKARGQNKIGKILLSRAEAEIAQKMGTTVEAYVKAKLELIAKKRRWKWYFERKTT